jgi:hypothetical protein
MASAAPTQVRSISTVQLLELWHSTESTSENILDVSMVRGWILDELDSRDPDAFDEWMDSDDCNPAQFFLGRIPE